MKRILCVSERPHGVVAHFVFVPPPTTGTGCTRPTLHHGARRDQSERETPPEKPFSTMRCRSAAICWSRAPTPRAVCVR